MKRLLWWAEVGWISFKCLMGYHSMEWHCSASYTEYRCKYCFAKEKPIIYRKHQ